MKTLIKNIHKRFVKTSLYLGLLLFIFPSANVLAATNGYASNPDTNSYPSSSLVGGYTPIRASDIQTMRTLINNKRVAAGLAPYIFTDPVLTPGVSLIRARHFAELAVALKDVFNAPSPSTPPNIWSQYYQQNLRSQLYQITPPGDNPSHVSNMINQPIRASTITALRNSIDAAGSCGDGICQNYSGNGPENCTTCPGDCRSGCSTVINPTCGAACGSAGTCNALSRCQTTTCPAEAACTIDYACVASMACSCGNGTCDALTGENQANCPSDCTPPAVCGNHKLEAGEECEVGLPMAAADCARLGPYTGTAACTNCKIDLSGCVSTLQCGNGVVDPGEDCDGSVNKTCTDLGLSAGRPGLACGRDCKWDTSGCGVCKGGPVNGLYPVGIKATWAPDWCDPGSCPNSTVVSVNFERNGGVRVNRYKTPVCTPPGLTQSVNPTSARIAVKSFVPATIDNITGGNCTLNNGCSPACVQEGPGVYANTSGQSIAWDTMYCYYSYVNVCGNGVCESGENGTNCGEDCGSTVSCSDGIQNQGETGVDCGGPCAACASNPCSGATPSCSACPATGALQSDIAGCCASRCLPDCDTSGFQWSISGGCGGQCAAPLSSNFTQCATNEACSVRSGSSYNGPACYYSPGSSDYACKSQPADCNCGDGICGAREDFFHCPADCAHCSNPPDNAVLCSNSYQDSHTSNPTTLMGQCPVGNACSNSPCMYCCPTGTHYLFNGGWATARCIPDSCGNGVLNSGEQCDGSALNGQTCQTRGFFGGSLTCTATCDFNTSACH